MNDAERERRLRELERRFRRAGLPLLAEDVRATEDVFTRAIPLLALVFVLELFGAINLEWSPLANAVAIAGGVVLLLGAFGALNVARGRPFRSIPSKLGVPELVAFVALPVVLPLVFGGQLPSALATAGAISRCSARSGSWSGSGSSRSCDGPVPGSSSSSAPRGRCSSARSLSCCSSRS